MKGAMKIMVLTLICVFAFTSVVSVASASSADAKAAQVITTDTSHSEKIVTQFAAGQTVYVEYVIQAGKTANIIVVDDDDNMVSGTSHPLVSGSGEFSFTPPHPGNYYVDVDGYKAKQIASASFFVLPEVLGTVAALGTGIAAFGIVKFKKKK